MLNSKNILKSTPPKKNFPANKSEFVLPYQQNNIDFFSFFKRFFVFFYNKNAILLVLLFKEIGLHPELSSQPRVVVKASHMKDDDGNLCV